MKRLLWGWVLIVVISWMPFPAWARNVSYVGGTTFMSEFNDDSVYGLWHYTLTPQMSVGLRQEYFREEEESYSAFQLNYLLRRWNNPDSQANLYLLTRRRKKCAADWEDRTYFVSYENRYYDAGTGNDFFIQKLPP